MKGNSNPTGRGVAEASQTATASRPAASNTASVKEGLILNSTTEAFKARFQQQKREQDQALSAAELATKTRHQLMLQALTTIRKSLLELRRIELGDRFRLEITADEWRGWPRIIVSLGDNVIRDAEYPKFQVSANDRQEKGLIEINSGAAPTSTSPPLVTVAMRDDSDLARLPIVLKRSVRNYLDTIAQTILEAERKLDNQLEETMLSKKTASEFEEKKKVEKQPELSGDLFEDQIFTKGPFEVLTSVGDVGSLPGFDDGAARSAARSAEPRSAEKGPARTVQPQVKNESSKLDAVEDLFLSEMLKD